MSDGGGRFFLSQACGRIFCSSSVCADDARRCFQTSMFCLSLSALAIRVRRPIGILAIPLTFALVFSGVHSPVSKRSDRFVSYAHSLVNVRTSRDRKIQSIYHRARIVHKPAHRRPLRKAIASWYGPADSGGNLACGGGSLTSLTLGVANKTLPCNTKVRVCENPKGPCVNVSVIDRGPYVAGREFDLTEATARAIGFLSRGVGPVWVSIG